MASFEKCHAKTAKLAKGKFVPSHPLRDTNEIIPLPADASAFTFGILSRNLEAE